MGTLGQRPVGLTSYSQPFFDVGTEVRLVRKGGGAQHTADGMEMDSDGGLELVTADNLRGPR